MTWWCAASPLSWSWTPRAYPGVWAFMISLLTAGYLAVRRTGIRPTGRQKAAWFAGVATLWLATDWPVGALGSGYLVSVHMLQYYLYTFVAAPLLVLGVPGELARQLLERWGLMGAYRALAKPLAAALIANFVAVATHVPVTVDALRVSQLGSFALDVTWLISGILLWLPICGPIEELRPSYAARSFYLFLATGVIPMVPGAFLVFAEYPLYALYELAPRVGGLDPVADQALAGMLMKVGSQPLIWPIIFGMFFRWAKAEHHPGRSVRPAPVPAATTTPATTTPATGTPATAAPATATPATATATPGA